MTFPMSVKIEETAGEENPVLTRNISSSGVYFEFRSPIDIGTRLDFVLTLPEQITKGSAVQIKCVGKVARVDRSSADAESIGVAVTIERYEFLRES